MMAHKIDITLEKINSVVIAVVNTSHLERKPPRGGIPATESIKTPKVPNKIKLFPNKLDSSPSAGFSSILLFTKIRIETKETI